MTWFDSEGVERGGDCVECGAPVSEEWHSLCSDCFRQSTGWGAPTRPDREELRRQHEGRTATVTTLVAQAPRRVGAPDRPAGALGHGGDGDGVTGTPDRLGDGAPRGGNGAPGAHPAGASLCRLRCHRARSVSGGLADRGGPRLGGGRARDRRRAGVVSGVPGGGDAVTGTAPNKRKDEEV